VTPYLDPNQITSGTLAYALAAGRAIVSTRYLHAAEALADGRGILVDFRSADALAEGINSILDDSHLRRRLERNAQDYGRDTAWPIVARRTVNLYREACATATVLAGRSAGTGRRSRRVLRTGGTGNPSAASGIGIPGRSRVVNLGGGLEPRH